jgi:hypothetical protein
MSKDSLKPVGVKVIANDLLREIVEQAHMAGQCDAGVDPSYSNARAYYDSMFTTRSQRTNEEKGK